MRRDHLRRADPPGRRSGVCAYNTVEHLLAWLATFAAGKTWIPLNPRNGAEELNRIVAATRPTIVVTDADCRDKVDPQGATRIIGKPGGEAVDEPTLADLISAFDGARPARHDPGPDGVQAIKFTGGSSGRPKGCIQTYRVWNTRIASMLEAFRFDAGGGDLHDAGRTESRTPRLFGPASLDRRRRRDPAG